MASLATVTKETRLTLKILAALSVGGFLLFMIFKGGALLKNILFPTPAPPPVQKFGKLPHIDFPSKGGEGIEYRINTVSGQLPVLADRSDVYEIAKPQPNLLALDNARSRVSNDDFVQNETKITDTLYQWTQINTGIIIQYDILDQNFTIASNYLNNPGLSSNIRLPDKEKIKQDVIAYLGSIGSPIDDIDLGKSKVVLLQNSSGNLIEAENLANAKYANINLVQNDINGTGIVYPDPTRSILNFTVSYPVREVKPLEGQFYHYRPVVDTKSDYPIKTADQGLEDLKRGNAYIINPQKLTTVDITDVAVKFYLGDKTKDYFLPVIVYTGINFTAYVEAIPDTSLADGVMQP